MTSQSKLLPLEKRDKADYGFHRARDIAFDAITALWRRREAAGMKQKDIADIIGRDRGWVSKTLRGPGNWTLRTIGELVVALDGELEIRVHAMDDAVQPAQNFHAYVEYPEVRTDQASDRGVQVIKFDKQRRTVESDVTHIIATRRRERGSINVEVSFKPFELVI